jgi:hypothetical protein
MCACVRPATRQQCRLVGGLRTDISQRLPPNAKHGNAQLTLRRCVLLLLLLLLQGLQRAAATRRGAAASVAVRGRGRVRTKRVGCRWVGGLGGAPHPFWRLLRLGLRSPAPLCLLLSPVSRCPHDSQFHWRAACCLLPAACCLLPAACCPHLPAAYNPLADKSQEPYVLSVEVEDVPGVLNQVRACGLSWL